MMDFYVIKLSENKDVYLTATGTSFKWATLEFAIYWHTWDDAEKFGKRYFKNYNDWTVEEKLIEL